MAFVSLAELTNRLGRLYLSLEASSAGIKRRDLRETSQKRQREEYYVWIFSYAYTGAIGVSDKDVHIQMEPEYSAHDATIRFVHLGQTTELKVQLKELPPAHLNPKITVQDLASKVQGQYRKSPDVTIAIFLNRNEKHRTQVKFDPTEVAGIWFFGYSSPDHRELFLVGIDKQGQREARVRFHIEVE